MESVSFPDNGGRRGKEDRRRATDVGYSPDRRSGQERRGLEDRRETPRM
jgi:hypothetical protein